MKRRVEKIVGLMQRIYGWGFPSVFAKILRYEADKLGYHLNLPFMILMIQKLY